MESYVSVSVAAEPIKRNTDLGYYTNFVNLLDLCAIAVPSRFGPSGLRFGVTLVGTTGRDGFVLDIADRLHRVHPMQMGATGIPVPACRPAKDQVVLAVVGAHLRGLPLNPQLLERRARFLRQCRTAPAYRLYYLPGAVPRKPGLVRVSSGGVAIETELWQMPIDEFGEFVANMPAPLCMGTIALETGELVKGFLCESAYLRGANDISNHGGWRRFLSRHDP